MNERNPQISLRGFYVTGAVATAIGIVTVFLLNLATPMDFFRVQLAELAEKDTLPYLLEAGKRLSWLLLIIVANCALVLYLMGHLLRPLRYYLSRVREGRSVSSDLVERARRRLLNLPFLFIPVSLSLWLVIPAALFAVSHVAGIMDFRTALVLCIRATMVGAISSGIGFIGLEAQSRKQLIPFLFPDGHLADLKGTARIPISRRIRMLYRLGSLVPMTILMVTLFTLQLELETSTLSTLEYGRSVIFFTLTLTIIFFITTGILNRMVSRSITAPLHNMLSCVASVRKGDYDTRIVVVGNDEIGLLADAGNAMIRGLAEREMIRNVFGKYVTPEIRDEIIAGRIPLEGERREATVLFADLRNFTPFVEQNPPEEVIAGMRAYFTAMHGAIRLHRGLVLQFAGDELEAVFGVPVAREDHADAAVRAALDMRRALEEFNRVRALEGKPPFAHGIGIHSGRVLAGNSGSEEQSAYALIGDTVNLASRIQGLTKELNCDLLVSRDTVERLKDAYPMAGEEPRYLKGYSKPIVVYRIPK